MIIEFAGPSCSGKSTLILRLQQELVEQGLAARTTVTWRTSAKDARRALRNPNMVIWCLLNPRALLRRPGRQLLGAIGATQRLRRERAVVLLDEGPVKLHKRRLIRNARGDRFLWSGMPAPDVLVIVTCSPEVRLARLRRTDRPHARTWSDQEILTDVTGDQFARRFALARGVRVIELDTTSGSDVFPELDEKLRPLLRTSPASDTTDHRTTGPPDHDEVSGSGEVPGSSKAFGVDPAVELADPAHPAGHPPALTTRRQPSAGSEATG